MLYTQLLLRASHTAGTGFGAWLQLVGAPAADLGYLATSTVNLQRNLALVVCALAAACTPPTPAKKAVATTAKSRQPPAFAPPPGQLVFVSERDGNPELYVIQTDGSGLRRLTTDPDGNFAGPIAPGGTHLLMLHATDAAGHREQIHVLSWSNGQVQQNRAVGPASTKIRNPAWTHDGTAIVFEADTASFRDLYRVGRDGGEPVRLTDNREGNFEPSVRADGTIAFVSSRSKIPAIYTMKADGSDVRRLTEPPGHCSEPVWSPDGSKIAFVRTGPRSSETYVMRADGSEQRPVRATPLQSGTDRDLSWSPSGASLALTHVGQTSTEVRLIAVDRGTEVVVSPKSAIAQQPVWLGNDAVLVWSATVDNNADLYAYEVASGKTVRLTHHPAPDWLPRWLGPAPSNGQPTPAQAPPSAP